MTFGYWSELDKNEKDPAVNWILLAGFIAAGVIALIALPLTGGK
jgi:hypothetical protein